MSEPGAAAPRLADSAIAEVMALLRSADSVELKATVPADAHRDTLASLPLDPIEAQPRQVFFFDTPGLALDAAGVVVRARRIQGGRGDSVVKLRPVVPDRMPPDVRRSAAFGVEVDVMPGGFVCSGSMKGRASAQEVRDVVTGKMALRKLLSKEQRAFYAANAPDGLDLDVLVPLGPTFVLKSRFATDTHPGAIVRSMVAELWLLPDGSRILELSTKCEPAEAFQVAAETRGYLASLGIELGAVQQAKTRATLAWYRDASADPAARPAG